MGAVWYFIFKGVGWWSEIIGNFECLILKVISDVLEELSNNIFFMLEDIVLVCKIVD